MQPTRIELLQRMPVFGAIAEPTLRFLLEQVREVAVPAGGHFFREHDAASSMFVLERGSVTVLRQWQQRTLVLRQFGPGDCFGEMALMDLGRRSATVRADEDCRAIEIDAGDLLRLFEHDPAQFALVQMNIGREVCRRLRHTDELLFRALMGEAMDGPPPIFGSG